MLRNPFLKITTAVSFLEFMSKRKTSAYGASADESARLRAECLNVRVATLEPVGRARSQNCGSHCRVKVTASHSKPSGKEPVSL
jgi:hypothetical protein